MKLATWNVNSIVARLPLVTRWLEKEKPDVVCLQETKCSDDKFPLLEIKSAGYDCVLFGQQSYNGVAILSKDGCALVQRGYPEDDASSHSRLLAADVAGIRVVNVYVPNGQVVGSDKYQFKLQWMKRLREMFDESYQTSTLCCCVVISTSRLKNEMFTIRACGKTEFCSARRSAKRCNTSKSGGSPTLFACTPKKVVTTRGGIIARAGSGAISVYASIIFGYRRRWRRAVCARGLIKSLAGGNARQITRRSWPNSIDQAE
jgi:hypothetical protein